MPVSKVDSKCFNLTKKVDTFLSLGNVGKNDLTPPDFWKELAQSEETVSSYIVCLIAKLISLDSEHGLKPLPNVYHDLVEMPVDHSKYKSWASKPLPANARSSALELQFAIVMTIKHLKDCHGYVPNIHLRHMYLRWNLARNFTNGGTKKADGFEESVITAFSVAQSKEVIRSPLHKVAISPDHLGKTNIFTLVKILVEECYLNHRRSFFGVLPPWECKLCNYSNAKDSLSYVRLRNLISKSPQLLNEAIHHVLQILRNEVSHSQDYGDREVLLPLLHIFRELLTMLGPIDTVETYQMLMPFYVWPFTHSEFTKKVLDLILLEGKVKGTSYRRNIIAEHDLGIKPSTTKIRNQYVHMMVDTSHPLSRGSLVHSIFANQQEIPDQRSLLRLIIRNVFKSVTPSFDVVELEGKLQQISSDALKEFCLEAMDLMEKSVSSGSGTVDSLKPDLDSLEKRIVEYAESDEQRDSAVSCSSIDGELRYTDDHLGSFPFPQPHIHSHPLENTQYPTVLAKLRDILVKCQAKLPAKSSPVGQRNSLVDSMEEVRRGSKVVVKKSRALRTFSNSSVESTGSITTETDGPRGEPATPTQTLGNGFASHMTNGENHVTFGSSPVTDIRQSPDSVEKERMNASTEERRTFEKSASLPQGSVGVFPNDSSDWDSVCSSPSKVTVTSVDGSSRASDDDTIRESEVPNASLLMRRQTCPSGMLAPKRNSLIASVSPSAKRYTNVTNSLITSPRSMSISGRGSAMGSLKVKMRGKPSSTNMSVKKRKRKTSTHVLSPTHKPNLTLLKMVLAGNDTLVSYAARAYAHLKSAEPNLFTAIDVRFYHVPLSRASMIHGFLLEPISASASVSGNTDLQEPFSNVINRSGNDVHIGRFISHMDSWYERNVMLAVHHLLRLLPCDLLSNLPENSQRPTSPVTTEGESTTNTRTALTPSKMLIDTITYYTREASHCMRIKMMQVKMNLKSEKTHKIEHREEYMLHRLDIQRLSGKKQANRQVKPFEANVTMTELTLDNSLVRSELMELKDVWALRASNIPRAGDSGVPNPEAESFELTITKAIADGGRFGGTKYHLQEECQYHVCALVLEARGDKSMSVMVDGDPDLIVDNVIRLEVSPAYMGQSFVGGAGTHRNDAKTDTPMEFPLMSYWPIDL